MTDQLTRAPIVGHSRADEFVAALKVAICILGWLIQFYHVRWTFNKSVIKILLIYIERRVWGTLSFPALLLHSGNFFLRNDDHVHSCPLLAIHRVECRVFELVRMEFFF